MKGHANNTHHKKEKDKPILLTGNLLHYGEKNLNGRIYTKEMAERIVEQFENRDGEMFGELGYPDRFEVLLTQVSHKVEEIHLDEENKSVVGTIKILDTPKGKIVKAMLDTDEYIGLTCRPRGAGTVNENSEIENYTLYSFDLVSGPDAFANIKKDDHLTILEDE